MGVSSGRHDHATTAGVQQRAPVLQRRTADRAGAVHGVGAGARRHGSGPERRRGGVYALWGGRSAVSGVGLWHAAAATGPAAHVHAGDGELGVVGAGLGTADGDAVAHRLRFHGRPAHSILAHLQRFAAGSAGTGTGAGAIVGRRVPHVRTAGDRRGVRHERRPRAHLDHVCDAGSAVRCVRAAGGRGARASERLPAGDVRGAEPGVSNVVGILVYCRESTEARTDKPVCPMHRRDGQQRRLYPRRRAPSVLAPCHLRRSVLER
eukprot:ctg_1450.g534